MGNDIKLSNNKKYCGKFFKKISPFHDGYCGPTNGPECN